MKKILILLIIVLIGIGSVSAVYVTFDSQENSRVVNSCDWIEYDAVLTQYNPANSSQSITETSKMKIEFKDIQEKNYVLNVTFFYSDGTRESSLLSGEVGKDDFTGFIVPSDLNVHDIVTEGNNTFTIFGVENQNICGQSREIVFANITTMEGMVCYWDNKTGVLVKANRDTVSIYYDIEVTDTNIW
ncbi:MAG: hypothetical protein CW691_00810 [Candidatus Bathyarchaeum sp.]|nr:MAG: hypothetical protein CW691_00810 [Candidatus Bathyarchaeum sp.]